MSQYLVKYSCDDCLTPEHELSRTNEYYVNLIVQHDQMIRDGAPNAGTLDNLIKKARRRGTAAARLLLTHRASHEARPRQKQRVRLWDKRRF